MLTAHQLLRLYPRSWRERYGEEFLAAAGSGPLRVQQVIDIVSGAVDAWFSADVRRATHTESVAATGDRPMAFGRLRLCGAATTRYTRRDALMGAGIMIVATAIFSGLGIAARRDGWQTSADVLLNTSFLGSLTLSLPFWLLKGQPWRAQTAVVGSALVLLVIIAIIAAR